MPTLRTPLKRKTKGHISQSAVDAWLAGDTKALKESLGLGPWEHSPLPPEYAIGYALPEAPTEGRGWAKCKRYQEELIQIAGMPPEAVRRAVAAKRLAVVRESLNYLRTPMARQMAHNKERHEERIRDLS
jgi:hypothetical protein